MSVEEKTKSTGLYWLLLETRNFLICNEKVDLVFSQEERENTCSKSRRFMCKHHAKVH